MFLSLFVTSALYLKLKFRLCENGLKLLAIRGVIKKFCTSVWSVAAEPGGRGGICPLTFRSGGTNV